jgi:hypothetical protein
MMLFALNCRSHADLVPGPERPLHNTDYLNVEGPHVFSLVVADISPWMHFQTQSVVRLE